MLISCAVTAQLICTFGFAYADCAFGFAYADCWFPHAKAHLSVNATGISSMIKNTVTLAIQKQPTQMKPKCNKAVCKYLSGNNLPWITVICGKLFLASCSHSHSDLWQAVPIVIYSLFFAN